MCLNHCLSVYGLNHNESEAKALHTHTDTSDLISQSLCGFTDNQTTEGKLLFIYVTTTHIFHIFIFIFM